MKEIPIQDNKNIPPITKGILKQVFEKITEGFSFLRSKIWELVTDNFKTLKVQYYMKACKLPL